MNFPPALDTQFWTVFAIGVGFFAASIHAFRTGRFPFFYLCLLFACLEAAARQTCSTSLEAVRHYARNFPQTFAEVRGEIRKIEARTR